MGRRLSYCTVAGLFALFCYPVEAALLKVGPGHPYATIEAAYAAAAPADIILVYPRADGTAYSRTRLYITKSNISIIGQAPPGKRVVLDGAGFNYSGVGSTPRAVFQFNYGVTNWLVANFEIKNCSNTSYNGAAFRINQGNYITIRNCEVHHCDMGFMSNGSVSAGTAANVLIEDCVIHDNGNLSDPGYNHNLYMGGTSVILRGCNVYSSTTGHNVKSRAHVTILDGCFIHHSANRELDLVDEAGNTTVPNSHALVKGCVIMKHPSCPGNRAVINFGQDLGNDRNGTLYVINTTIVTPFTSPVVDLSAPNAGVCFINTLVADPNGSGSTKTLVNARNGASYTRASGQNLWLSYGFTPPAGGSFSAVTIGARGYIPPFRQPSRGDCRLMTALTGIVDAGRTISEAELPPKVQGFPLRCFAPDLGSQLRLNQNLPDVGAFEWREVT